jgi:hypothetical protein
MEDDALDKIAKEIIANEAGIKSFDQLINEFETDMLKGLSQADAADFANWYLDSGFDKEGKARAWLNANTDRLADPRMVDDDTSFSMEQQGFDEVAETNKAYDLENALTDDEIFMRDVQPDIDDYYADLAAREPNVDTVNSYYESLSQADQGMIDAYYDNMIDDAQRIQVADTPVTGKVIKQTIKNRLKRVLIGGVDALDFYELGLIGMALIEPGVQKALQPIMPMIIPGYKGKVDSKTYGQQVIENLQMTAKISPTAKVAEKIADIPKPQTQELTGMGWVGKMLSR